jgi:hypothetical protein
MGLNLQKAVMNGFETRMEGAVVGVRAMVVFGFLRGLTLVRRVMLMVALIWMFNILVESMTIFILAVSVGEKVCNDY